MRITKKKVNLPNKVKLKEVEKRDKYLDLASEQKTMEHEGDGDINCNWCSCSVTKGLIKGLEDMKIRELVENI